MTKVYLALLSLVLLLGCGHLQNKIDSPKEIEYNVVLNKKNDFMDRLKSSGFYDSTNDYHTKKYIVLSNMSDLFWNNAYVHDSNEAHDVPGVIGIAYERDYSGFEIYSIYQSGIWFLNNNPDITSIEFKDNHYTHIAMKGDPVIPFSERHYLKDTIILSIHNEVLFYLAIRDKPFQYYAFANVIEGAPVHLLDSLLSK